ncbi:cobalamin biosynthesis protein CobD [Thiomicrorhabdus immobilis]|uniref:Cobalamin biosynthesis protein CobD n=1 Tax=Thiomicrorhabdus immobilis TaxID=2791037 RepID=A0ABN6CWW1_9GAMM|nr:adenosylcobinamide-phosphate synthase CbiB [Thiomicrorhabdus immobilis]BCN93194.1 cobalamin biosynthesis protein CobD [Thiomicrorhabdus immobilis]
MLLFDFELILTSALLAVLVDRLFGEFKGIRHPVILMGDWISFFERHFYQATQLRGVLLLASLLLLCLGFSGVLVYFFVQLPGLLNILFTGLFASMLLAHRMLFDSVNALINNPDKRQAVAMLVSRDTQSLSDGDCYKAGIETYAENLSDGYIAPLFWFLLAGLPGLVVYKAVNTLDSMVGYRNARYADFGKASAKMDDLLNWIPARITALLIMILSAKSHLSKFYPYGKKHDSPNAGHPISAMALHCQCQLGGDTYYFGELKHKAYFGEPSQPQQITAKHLQTALKLRNKIDAVVVFTLFSLLMIFYVV